VVDHLSKEGRSRNMAAIRSKNTRPELALRAMLRAAGATGYRIHARAIPGRPDVAFTRWRVAVFVDGAFWHGHPDHFEASRATDHWRNKIARTQERDRAADAVLSSGGWAVLRFWDFDLAAHPETCSTGVLSALGERGWKNPHAKANKATEAGRV